MKFTLVHFDAHPDIYDSFEGSRSSHACQFARICEENLVAQLISIGVRTVTPHQRDQMRKFGVSVVEAREVGASGARMGDVLRGLVRDQGLPVYVSLDLDVLELGLAPGVSHREAGGLTPRQVIDALHALPGRVLGADLVEYNPTRDVNGLTAAIAGKLLKELAAKIIAS